MILRGLIAGLACFTILASAVESKLEPSTETSGCKKTHGKKSDIDMDFAVAERMFFAEKPLPFSTFPEDAYCIKNHQRHRLILYETKQVLGDIEIALVGHPTTLRNFFESAKENEARYPGIGQWADNVRWHFNLLFPQTKEDDPVQPVAFTSLHKSDDFFNPYTSLTPKIHRFAKTLDYLGTAKLVATEKPFIVDIRIPEYFKIWHLPNAQDFPPVIVPALAGRSVDYRPLLQLQSVVPLSRVPADKTLPILVMGPSETDWLAYYTVSMLRMSGYTNLYWYRGGQEDWHLARRFLPDGEAPGNVETITWQELEKKLSSVNVVDVRRPSLYSQGHVPHSLSVYYYTNRVPPLIGAPYELENFTNDLWNESVLPVDKSKPLVLVGTDETDWQAVIATRKALSLGYKAVWYKGGASEWQALNNWFGELRFPLVKAQIPAKAH